MAFGFKIKTVKTKNKYSIDSLYEAIKDKQFSAGVPELTKHGFNTIITFPPIDSRNQVWIMPAGFGKETNKFSVQKQEKAGVTSMATNAALDGLTKGYAGMHGVFGSHAKEAEKLVEATAKELDALGL